MLLENNFEGFQALYREVGNYYEKRHCSIYECQAFNDGDHCFVRFLVDRFHVVQYSFRYDRGFLLSGVGLAIGPHFFGPADFWSYDNMRRFALEASTEAIRKNLELLDEYFKSR